MNRKLIAALLIVAALVVGALLFESRRIEVRGEDRLEDAGAPEQSSRGATSKLEVKGAPLAISPNAGSDAGAVTTVVNAQWGSGPGQLGHERRQEGNAEGPMSLFAAKNGDVLIVDQSNGRLARFGADGKWKDSVPLPVQSAQDAVQTPDGKTLVMDRLADGQVAILDEHGKPIGQLPIVGANVKEAGGVTGLFVDGNDVYVEQEHGVLSRIGDTQGIRDEQQPQIPGRPSRDGKFYVSAGIVEPQAGRVFVNAIDRAQMAQRFTREYRLTPVTGAIVLLDTDDSGVIYLGVLSDDGAKESVTLLCLDPLDGRPLGTNNLPANSLPEETFRDFAVMDSGGVLYSYRTEQGVEVRRYECR